MKEEAVKEIIRKELPGLVQKDYRLRAWVIEVTRKRFAGKEETESRFDRLLEELRADREKQDKKWEENQKEIRLLVESVHKLSKKHDSSIGALGARWGLNTEESFRSALKSILEESFPVEVINVNEYDDDGEVFGTPDQVELDIIIKNGMVIALEIKSSVSKADMHVFYRKAKFYEKRHGRSVSRMVVISPMVDKRALKLAREYGIEVHSGAEEVAL